MQEENEFNILTLVKYGFCCTCTHGYKEKDRSFHCALADLNIDNINDCQEWPDWYPKFSELKFIIGVKNEDSNSI